MTAIEKSTVVQESIHIAAAPEQVWRLFRDVERWPLWCPVILSAKMLSGDLSKARSRFRFSVKPSWIKLQANAEVVQAKPPGRVTWGVEKNGAYAQHTFSFEPDGEGTRATSYEAFSGPMLWALPIVMPSGKVRAMFQSWLLALKTEAEKDR